MNVRHNSNALLAANDALELSIRHNSNALEFYHRTDSNYNAYVSRIHSNAISELDMNVRHNSNALLAANDALELSIRHNSNALEFYHRTDSNYNAYVNRIHSNAISELDMKVRHNSNALLATNGDLENQIANNSNAIIVLEQNIRYNSQTINMVYNELIDSDHLAMESRLDNLEKVTRNNSRFIVANSNAISTLDMKVRTNSNLLMLVYNEVSDISLEGISDGHILSSRIDAVSNLSRTTSHAVNMYAPIVRNNSYLLRHTSNVINHYAPIIRNNSYLLRTTSNAVNFMASEYTGLAVHAEHVAYPTGGTITDPTVFKEGFSVGAGQTLELDAVLPVSGNINLADTGILQLNGDLILDSQAYLTSGGVLKGEGNTLVLTSSLVIPAGKTLTLGSNIIIDGQGNNLVMGAGAKLQLDTTASVTLRNLNWFNDGDGSIINITDDNAQITLDNVNTAFDTDVAFNNGYLFIANDVSVQGPKKLTYGSLKPLTVEPFAQLKFDFGSTFSFSPNPTGPHTINDKNLLRLTDSTSELYFNNCTVAAPDYGLKLTKGTVLFDNKVNIEGNTTVVDANHSIELGDGTANGEVEVKVLSGANVTVNGYLFHNTAA